MGQIPGTPFSIAVMGLIKVTRGGGQARAVELPRIGVIAVERSVPVVDVTALEVLISALTGDLKTLQGQVVEAAELERVEQEILLLLELIG